MSSIASSGLIPGASTQKPDVEKDSDNSAAPFLVWVS